MTPVIFPAEKLSAPAGVTGAAGATGAAEATGAAGATGSAAPARHRAMASRRVRCVFGSAALASRWLKTPHLRDH